MLLRASEESIERTLLTIGSVVLLALSIVGYLVIARPFTRSADGHVAVSIETPFVGQGVKVGTALVNHGVEIGKVTEVSTRTGGGIRLSVNLDKSAAVDLSDTMKIDFRPVNYFGVTGINVTPTAGGHPVRNGMLIDTVPLGNFTLQALLSQLGEVSASTLTPQLISAIDRGVRYTDALNPLIETMIVALQAVDAVQELPTERLLANTTGIAVAFPAFTDSLIHAGNGYIMPKFEQYTSEFFESRIHAGAELSADKFYALIGQLETNYVDELLPAVDMTKAITDTVPALLRPAEFSDTMVELRTRLEKLFAGTPEQRALQVRIVLDKLPGVASALGE